MFICSVNRTKMDWNQKSDQRSFHSFFVKYFSKAKEKISDEQKQKLKEPLQLTPFEKAAIISILKQTVAKISVINKAFDVRNKLTELPTPKLSMAVRFQENHIEKLYDEKTLQPLRECYKAMSENKLKDNIELIRCAMELCAEEIENSDRFDRFTAFIFSENRESNDEYNLLFTYSNNLNKLKDLQRQLKQSRIENEASLRQLDNDLFTLKTECEDKQEILKLETRMVAKWESARHEQVEAVFNHELKMLNKMEDDLEEKMERELVVINEVMAFYRAKCSKLESLIERWERRLESEQNELDDSIEHTKENIEDVRSKHKMIKNVFLEREEFIENYYIEQKQLEECRRMEAEKCAAAIRMQAWWRGTMVRKQLGTYRPKKKNKKPKAGRKS